MTYREKTKDLKLNFRYLCDNIACLSVDSINGKPVHNDINNEEAIIIFNSLVGEKDNCQTIKTLLEENAELKKQTEEYKDGYFRLSKENIEYVNKLHKYKFQQKELEKDLEDKIVSEMNLRDENRRLRKEYQDTYKDVRIEIKEYKNQQKEFIEYLENEKDRLIKECSHHYIDSFDRQHSVNEDIFDEINEILSKYKEIIGGNKDDR